MSDRSPDDAGRDGVVRPLSDGVADGAGGRGQTQPVRDGMADSAGGRGQTQPVRDGKADSASGPGQTQPVSVGTSGRGQQPLSDGMADSASGRGQTQPMSDSMADGASGRGQTQPVSDGLADGAGDGGRAALPVIDGYSVMAIRGIPGVRPGDDLAALITTAAPWLRDGDILVVTSKIVSKAEGQLVDVPTEGPEREAARDAVLRAETARVVATRGHTRIVQTHHGFVMASAGIDASNVDRSQLVLLPKDPDRSAADLRAALRERHGLDVAVVISDTTGRPWRNGLTDIALGCSGIAPLRDHRGEVDPHGNELHITQMAVADELASAAELVKGKTDQVPVAVIRGLITAPTDAPGVVPTLLRDSGSDLFSLGTHEAMEAGRADRSDAPRP